MKHIRCLDSTTFVNIASYNIYKSNTLASSTVMSLSLLE